MREKKFGLKLFLINILSFIILFPFCTFFVVNQKNEMIPKSNLSYQEFYEGNGSQIDILLSESYSNHSSNLMNSSDFNTTSIFLPSPNNQNFNYSFTNLSISNLQLHNISKTMQDDEGYSTYEDVNAGNSAAASITIPTSGNLTEIDIYLPIINTFSDITVEIFNSTWNGYQAWINASVGIFYTSVIDTSWYNEISNWATFYNNHFYLNNSQTANNTWYVALETNNGDYDWEYTDSVNPQHYINTTYSFSEDPTGYPVVWGKDLDSNGNALNQVIKFVESPLNYSPYPSDINFSVNNTLISFINSNYFWLNQSSGIFNNGNNFLYKFNCNWVNTTWNVNCIFISFSNNFASNQSTFYIPTSNSPVNWNLQYKTNLFENNKFDEFGMNFTVPQKFIPQFAYRDNFSNPILTQYWIDPLGEKIVHIDIDQLHANDNWLLFCNTSNIVNAVALLNNGISVNQISSNELLSLNLTFNTQISCNAQFEIISPTLIETYSSNIFSIYNQTSFYYTGINTTFFNSNSNGSYTIQINGTNNQDLAFLTEISIEFDTSLINVTTTSTTGNNSLINSEFMQTILIVVLIAVVLIISISLIIIKSKKLRKSKMPT